MSANVTDLSPDRPASIAGGRAAVQALVLLLLIPAALTWLYFGTVQSMAVTWWRHDTYQHGMLVFPIALWLLWRLRHRLLAAAWRPAWLAVGGVPAAGLVWGAGEIAGATVVSQFAWIGMLLSGWVAVFGYAKARVALFPLVFMVFAVPFGEAAIPVLMEWTANVTVASLRVSGIPVYRDGLWFVLPTGNWSVVEACSGLRFVLATVVVASLYSYLVFQSPLRRVAFFAIAIFASVATNWLRAYLTVLAGHLSNNRLMSGDDHILFGSVLFASMILLLFAFGLRFGQPSPAGSGAAAPRALSPPVAAAAVAVLFGAGVWPAVAGQLRSEPPAFVASAPRLEAPAEWSEVSEPLAPWSPHLVGPRSVSAQSFRKGDLQVDVHIGVFEYQRKGAELASAANRLVLDADEVWKLAARKRLDLGAGSVPREVNAGRVRESRQALLVWQWMVSGGEPTLSLVKGKVDVVRARLLGRSDRGLWIAIATSDDDAAPERAERALREFTLQLGPSLVAAGAAR